MNKPTDLGLTNQEKAALWSLFENEANSNPAFAEANCISKTYFGYTYDLMWFDDKCWFAENLQTSQLSDGTPIPQTIDISDWWGVSGSSFIIYNIDANGEAATHGYLYNHAAAVDPKGICPTGWHLPSEAEYTTWLTAAGSSVATLQTQNTEPADQYFQDRASGVAYNGLFDDIGVGTGYYVNSVSARYLSIFNDQNNANFQNGDARFGMSIRCLKND